ncbi:MAG TPA: endonuclease/exonuclease/phosphatase family protein [Planctomycetota bacterium]|nr:endonuclease/exonuclease/phosphatase family protein [Planctomycetota bacterium]
MTRWFSRSMPTLRCMTLNMAHARRGGPHRLIVRRERAEANLERMAWSIMREAPDVVALQEADAPSLWSGRFDHVEHLAKVAGYDHVFHGEHVCLWRGRRRICYGSAILSRFPLGDTASHRFARSLPTPTKGFVAATVKVPGRTGHPLRVASVHLDFARKRVRQSQVLHMATLLAGHAGPMLLLGDFNCQWAGREDTLQLLAGRLGVRPFRPAAESLLTFPSRQPRWRLDWILASADLDFRRYEVLPERLSDHLPVLAELAPAAAKPRHPLT